MKKSTVLVADDDAGIRTVLRQALSRSGYHVRATSSASALWSWVSAGEGDVVITDVLMPDENAFDLIPRIHRKRPELPVIVMSARNTFDTAIKAARCGAYEYLPKPFDLEELLRLTASAIKTRRPIKEQPPPKDLPLVGRSPAMQEVYRNVARLMSTDLSILIAGESGTGKDLVARALHDYGKRHAGPFVAINMASIPRDLIESELFGYEKGAFTGATQRRSGHFEEADGGTLFLDEIGDMPVEAQTRLLRVLQGGEYVPVGGRQPVKTDVRIIAATNKPLQELITQGLFREDLFYRLNVVTVHLPPLRERAQDILDLVHHFLHKVEKEGLPRKSLDKAALEALKNYHWPGNVRELENLIRRFAVVYPQDVIGAADVDAELREDRYNASMSSQTSLEAEVERWVAARFNEKEPMSLYGNLLEEVEQPLLRACLQATQGNQLQAARILGINRNTLRKKLRDLNITISPLGTDTS